MLDIRPAKYCCNQFPLHMFGVYALRQTRALATKLLTEGMMKERDSKEIEAVVQKISSRDTYASHGASIDYNEATDLGLSIEKLDGNDELWKRIWLLHCMYEQRLIPLTQVAPSRLFLLSGRLDAAIGGHMHGRRSSFQPRMSAILSGR